MNGKGQIALNRLFNLFVIVGLLFLFGSYSLIKEKEIGFGIGIGLLGLFFLIVPIITMPYYYYFDNDGISAHYLLFPQERYRWNNIYAITVTNDSSHHRSLLFDLIFSGVFEISGKVEGKRRFYMQSHIRKSRRTKRLIEKYWDGKVTGYFLENCKSWLDKCRKKKAAQIQAHLTDEVVPMERKTRAAVRAMIKPYIVEAKLYGLELRTRFVYVTKDFYELKSRPNAGYTYTVITDILHQGETDESRIVSVSADLLFVRLGRKAYRGVVNRDAEKEFPDMLEETLREIKENGIEVFHQNE